MRIWVVSVGFFLKQPIWVGTVGCPLEQVVRDNDQQCTFSEAQVISVVEDLALMLLGVAVRV